MSGIRRLMRERRANFLNAIRKLYCGTAFERLIASASRETGHPIWRSLAPGHDLYGRNELREFSTNDLRWKVDIGDYIGHGIYYGLDRSSDALFKLCTPTSTVLDIGSNLGWTALNLAKRAASGRVIAFEADPTNYSKCMANVGLNGLSNLLVECIGMADRIGTAHIIVDDEKNLGGNRISSVGGEEVRLTTIDTYCAEHRINKVDLIKIDTEGFEWRIIQGGMGTLKRDRPVLFIEVNNEHLARFGGDVKGLFSLLRSSGYEHFIIAGTNKVIDDESTLIGKHVDVIAR